MTSFIKSGFVPPSVPRSSPPPFPRYSSVHAPPSSPVLSRSPSPAPPPGCAEGSTEDDVTIPVHTDSVHLTPPPSLSSPLPPSSPSTHVQGEEHPLAHEAAMVGEIYYPSDKSQEQHDFEQGRIDYTGKDSFESLIQSSLDKHLEGEDSELGD